MRVALHFSHHLDRQIFPWDEIPPFETILSDEISTLQDDTIINFLVNYFRMFDYNLAFGLVNANSILYVHLNAFYYEPEIVFFNFYHIYKITEALVITYRKLDLNVTPQSQSLTFLYEEYFLNTLSHTNLDFLHILQKFLNFLNDPTILFDISFTIDNVLLHIIPTGIEYDLE